ncbi:MAG: energy transducer TonB [Bacteroidetes bacterium]|jgi:periplasmic protein TonB|nr:energy transducer TonB [Bacteroidota bacterium]MBT4398964.1 energy transducer TonB [Bacteroidota bacterium]MBT7465646.1 energy transducer TonB [Bacteroidota bacterium]
MKAIVKILLPGIAMLLFASSVSTLQAQNKKENVFTVVEDMPQFQGGDLDKFKTWVTKEVKYPKEAMKKGIKGKVYVSFVIDEAGKVTDVEVKKGADKLLNDEAVRAIKASPKWVPGSQRGKKVSVKMVLPVIFNLS